MANRNTVKANVVTKNVPTVTNAILTDILNTEMNDNIRFKEDYATAITATGGGATLDYSVYDRIDLTNLGSDTGLVVTGMNDGEEKWLVLNKTVGTKVNWFGVTNIDGSQEKIDAASKVVFQIFRKGSLYYSKALLPEGAATAAVEGVTRYATMSEVNAETSQVLAISPYTLARRVPLATQVAAGKVELATTDEITAGTDTSGSNPLVVKPSQLKTSNDRITTVEGKTTRYIAYKETTSAQLVNAASTQTFTITHNLGTTSYQAFAQIIYNATVPLMVYLCSRETNTATFLVYNVGPGKSVVALDVIIVR